jgi:biopolymer transport protein ExbB/TolQ
MQISQGFVAFAAFTAEILFYVLMSLNIASLAIVTERATFFWRRRIDADLLVRQVLYFLKLKDLVRARALVARLQAPECTVLLAGLSEVERGTEAVGEAMRSARIRERIRMETNLTMLKAVAFAAPALGALGTLLGVVSVMPHLAVPLVNAQGLVGTAVREGLGAVAIAAAGLMVGIPAAMASLLFDRRVQLSEERCAALTHLTLALVSQIYPPVRNADSAAEVVGSTDEAAKPEAPQAAAATPSAATLASSTLFVSAPTLRPEPTDAAKQPETKQQVQPKQNRRSGKAA